MKATELWGIFIKKNPQFDGGGTVTMTCAGLRKLFDTTWNQAHSAGFENGKAWAAMQKPAESLFGKIFGNPVK